MSYKDKRFWEAEDLLVFWQECHGELDPRWHKAFLIDDATRRIISTEMTKNKLVAIRRNRKLREILKDLDNQTESSEKFAIKENPWKESLPVGKDEPIKIVNGWYRWGGRWRKGF